MIRTVIFDWDGTLHNTEHLYGSAVRQALKEANAAGLVREVSPEKTSDAALRRYLGVTAAEMWADFMPELDKEQAGKMIRRVGTYLESETKKGTALMYDGAADVLDELKSAGLKLLFLSNCQRNYMNVHREYFQLDRWIDGFYCSEDYGYIPKPEIFIKFRNDWPGDFVMAGDRASDMAVGEVTGSKVVTIGCSYGYGLPGDLEKADHIADDIRMIPEIIKRINDYGKTIL